MQALSNGLVATVLTNGMLQLVCSHDASILYEVEIATGNELRMSDALIATHSSCVKLLEINKASVRGRGRDTMVC